MAKNAFLEIKVRVKDLDQKRLFERLADASQPLPLSLNNWMLIAALEKAEREKGLVPAEPAEKKKGSGR